MLTLSYGVQSLLLIGVPIGVAFWFNRRMGLSWALFFGGALAFVSAWVVVNFLPLPGELGLLLLSVTQMGALYLIFRFQLQDVHTERQALMAGVGQAGVELILLGILALLTLFQMAPLRDASDQTLISLAAQSDDIPEEEVQPSRIDELREIIDDFWSRPWYEPLIQPLQSLSYLPIQMALSVLVVWALAQDQWRLLLGAMALHFLSRILPLVGAGYGGLIVWLVLTLIFGGLALWFLARLWALVQSQTAVALRQARKKQD